MLKYVFKFKGGDSDDFNLPDVDKSCLNGCFEDFLDVENGVMGAFGSKRLRCGSFSISFLFFKENF
jgi:hypothetical protein